MSAENRSSITANGKEHEIVLPCTVRQFLGHLGWKPTQVVVELNGQVLAKGSLDRQQLAGGDQLEVIIPVAGG